MGANTRCIWVSKNMKVGDVVKLLGHAMGVVLREVKVWYSRKFDTRLLVPFQNDGDNARNDGHAYVYVTEMEGPHTPLRQGCAQQGQFECELDVVMVL